MLNKIFKAWEAILVFVAVMLMAVPMLIFEYFEDRAGRTKQTVKYKSSYRGGLK